MKRFSRLLSIEILEEKRLKAADLAASSMAYGPAFVDAADATPSSDSANDQLSASSIERLTMPSANLTAEDSADDSDSEEQQDETENETDGSDGDDTDNTDDTNDTNDEDETELSTELKTEAGAVQGSAEYESDTEDSTTERELTVKIESDETTIPDGFYDVKIGTFTTQIHVTGGNGKLKLSSDPDDDETLLPDDVTIEADTEITIDTPTPLTGTFAADSDSADLQSLSSGSGALQSLPATFESGSGSLQSAHPVSSQLTEAPNVSDDNTLDANLLLDAGFAATSPSLDSWRLAEFQPDLATDETDADQSLIDDAVFDMLVEGEYAWIV